MSVQDLRGFWCIAYLYPLVVPGTCPGPWTLLNSTLFSRGLSITNKLYAFLFNSSQYFSKISFERSLPLITQPFLFLPFWPAAGNGRCDGCALETYCSGWTKKWTLFLLTNDLEHFWKITMINTADHHHLLQQTQRIIRVFNFISILILFFLNSGIVPLNL